jgi:ribose transport system permease protein
MQSFSIRQSPWLFGFVGAAVLFVATIIVSHGGGASATFHAAMAFSIFSVLVAISQMLVITSGPGKIDLSVPAVLTLCAYLGMGVMHGSNAWIPVGLLVVAGVGLLAGAFNYAAILLLRLPPIIATLASSFVFQSLAMNAGGDATIKPPSLLSAFTSLSIGPISVLAVLVVLLTIGLAIGLRRSLFGRRLLATGQSEAAARFAGIRVREVRLISYAGAGLFAGLAGFLLAGFTGGAALNMGDTYLMESIAVVVLGGTSVAGGQANAIGIWGSALFFNLLTIMLNSFRTPVGLRYLLTGAIIILIVTAATRPVARS